MVKKRHQNGVEYLWYVIKPSQWIDHDDNTLKEILTKLVIEYITINYYSFTPIPS